MEMDVFYSWILTKRKSYCNNIIVTLRNKVIFLKLVDGGRKCNLIYSTKDSIEQFRLL